MKPPVVLSTIGGFAFSDENRRLPCDGLCLSWTLKVLESPTLENVVEHTVDAIADDGAAYNLKDPDYKLHLYHLPVVLSTKKE